MGQEKERAAPRVRATFLRNNRVGGEGVGGIARPRRKDVRAEAQGNRGQLFFSGVIPEGGCQGTLL